MPTVKIRILNGKTEVTADGSKVSCDTARDIQRAIGETLSEKPTGHKSETTKLVQN